MDRDALRSALRGLSQRLPPEVCRGCGYEHDCSTKGCAILRAARETITRQGARARKRKLVEQRNADRI